MSYKLDLWLLTILCALNLLNLWSAVRQTRATRRLNETIASVQRLSEQLRRGEGPWGKPGNARTVAGALR